MNSNNFFFKNIFLRKAIIFSLASIIGIFITIFMMLNLTSSIWLYISFLFLSIGISGNNKKEQFVFLTKFTVISLIFIPIGYYLELYLISNLIGYYLTIFIVILLSFISLAKIPKIKNVSHLLIYLMLLSGKNFGELNIIAYILPYLVGYLILLMIILILPEFSIPYKYKEFNKEELIRFFRVSLAVTIVLFISNYLHLFNPSWSALTVLVISQGTLGETIKKSMFRLAGTFFGIIVGIIAATYLFEPYEYSRFLILVLFFLGILFLQRSYTLSIFLFTIGLCGLSLLIFNTNTEFLEVVTGRFIDTLLGIFVLILLELIIFPYSVIKETRKFRKEYWKIIYDIFVNGDAVNLKKELSRANEVLDSTVAILKEYRYEPVSLFNKNYKYQREYFAQVKKINKIINNQYIEFLKNKEIKDYIIYLSDFLSKLNLKYVSKKDFDNMKSMPEQLKNTDLDNSINKIILVYYNFIKARGF